MQVSSGKIPITQTIILAIQVSLQENNDIRNYSIFLVENIQRKYQGKHWSYLLLTLNIVDFVFYVVTVKCLGIGYKTQ